MDPTIFKQSYKLKKSISTFKKKQLDNACNYRMDLVQPCLFVFILSFGLFCGEEFGK